METVRTVLLILCAASGLWSAVGGPIAVARRDGTAPVTVWLYIVRAVPLGAVVVILSLAQVFAPPAPALVVILVVSAVVQLADCVIGFSRRDLVLGIGALAFAIIQGVTALLFV